MNRARRAFLKSLPLNLLKEKAAWLRQHLSLSLQQKEELSFIDKRIKKLSK